MCAQVGLSPTPACPSCTHYVQRFSRCRRAALDRPIVGHCTLAPSVRPPRANDWAPSPMSWCSAGWNYRPATLTATTCDPNRYSADSHQYLYCFPVAGNKHIKISKRKPINRSDGYATCAFSLITLSKSLSDWCGCCGDNWIPIAFGWSLRFGGNGGGLLDLEWYERCRKWMKSIECAGAPTSNYRSGSGGFGGGGLESRNMLSMLCDVRICLACDCSKISRSRGVNGMSGSEVRWAVTSGRCSRLQLSIGLAAVTPPFLSRSDIFSLAILTRFCARGGEHTREMHSLFSATHKKTQKTRNPIQKAVTHLHRTVNQLHHLGHILFAQRRTVCVVLAQQHLIT